MDLATFERLRSPAGTAALAAAADLAPTDTTFLKCLERLRKHYPAELAEAAVETVLLRQRARSKFAQAGRMYFTRETLEVASGEAASAYRAERFRGFGTVGDFGCGIGADALALAAVGCRVEAVDRDPLRVRMAQANAETCGFADRIRVTCTDLLTDPLPPVEAAFADPGRRSDGQRFLSLRDYLPAPQLLRDRLPADFPLAFKLAPGLPRDELDAFAGEAEFLTVNGELKECVLWLGPFRTSRRRATILPGPHTLHADRVSYLDDFRQVGAYLYDPDPAVVRAELVPELAEQLHAGAVDATVQWLTSDTLSPTPYATAYRVEAVLPPDRKGVTAALRERRVGRVTVLNRGSKTDAAAWTTGWKLAGDEGRFLLLTHVAGEQVAVIADRV